jgi:predicted nucleic acid-binding protein
MNRVLVDSSVWIDYFRGSINPKILIVEDLIDANRIYINDLILTELIPFLLQKKEYHVVELLKTINGIPIQIDWHNIIDLQTRNLKYGINNIGIPDLIILQNVLQNNIILFSLDKHFRLLKKYYKFELL